MQPSIEEVEQIATRPLLSNCIEDYPGGAAILSHAYGIGLFVAYPSEHAHVAHTLWRAHTHLMEAWESMPRIAFLSPEPGSRNSRALEITESLVPRPMHSINATSAALF